MANKTKQPKRVLTEAQRLARNEKARARHWLKTGVSQRTVNWMRDLLQEFVDLKPIRPTKAAPRHSLTDTYSPGEVIWGRYNWSGWRYVTDLFQKWGVPMNEFSGMNDGEVISAATCKLVADKIEEHLHELPLEDQQWLKDDIILWRTCGGYKQF